MADTFRLQVATPEKSVVDEDVTMAELPGEAGYMGILEGLYVGMEGTCTI